MGNKRFSDQRGSGRSRSQIGRSLPPEDKGSAAPNDTDLLILLERSESRGLVGVNRAVGSESKVGEPEARAGSLGEGVAGDRPVALELEECRPRLAVDQPVGRSFENRGVAATMPGVRRADLRGDPVGRDLPDRPAIASFQTP
jgi:hypothetical protein